MAPEITNKEAVEMMNRCKQEILTLRATIDRLRPKAEAYDNLAILLGLLPKPSIGMGEDLVWTLERRIGELKPRPEASKPKQENPDATS
ncbi:MAG: hypothetical protein AB7S41_11325 [Parvibaculaceae bacterium]